MLAIVSGVVSCLLVLAGFAIWAWWDIRVAEPCLDRVFATRDIPSYRAENERNRRGFLRLLIAVAVPQMLSAYQFSLWLGLMPLGRGFWYFVNSLLWLLLCGFGISAISMGVARLLNRNTSLFQRFKKR